MKFDIEVIKVVGYFVIMLMVVINFKNYYDVKLVFLVVMEVNVIELLL